MAQPTARFQPSLALFSKALVVLTLGLIFLGALVKSHEAGLSVPDWPTSYGYSMFLFPPDLWIGGIFYEHVHRLYASVIGFLTVLLASWIFFREKRRSLKILGALSVCVVILQGVLGGLTVLTQLPAAISASHGTLAQLFLVLLVIIAYGVSKEWLVRRQSCERKDPTRPVFFRVGVGMGVLVLVQLILGAIMRHTESGLAVLDFPTMANSWFPSLSSETIQTVNEMRRSAHLPPITHMQLLAHLAHRLGGIALWIALMGCSLWTLRQRSEGSKELRSSAWMILLAVNVQFALGVASVLLLREPFLTSVHVALGAGLLVLVTLYALRAYPAGGLQQREEDAHSLQDLQAERRRL